MHQKNWGDGLATSGREIVHTHAAANQRAQSLLAPRLLLVVNAIALNAIGLYAVRVS